MLGVLKSRNEKRLENKTRISREEALPTRETGGGEALIWMDLDYKLFPLLLRKNNKKISELKKYCNCVMWGEQRAGFSKITGTYPFEYVPGYLCPAMRIEMRMTLTLTLTTCFTIFELTESRQMSHH